MACIRILEILIPYLAYIDGNITAYFFFRRKKPECIDVDLMLSSLVNQFSQHCSKMSASLTTLLALHDSSLKLPSVPTLLEALVDSMSEF